MELLKNIHNILRYVLLLLIIASIVKAYIGLANKTEYNTGDKKLNLFTLISSHLQLVLGLILYFTSETVKIAHQNMGNAMKDKTLRFWAVEHISMMILAIILITIGYSTSKRADNSLAKYKKIAIFFSIALILILAAIPWAGTAAARNQF
jgi:uncharacterized membrane protein